MVIASGYNWLKRFIEDGAKACTNSFSNIGTDHLIIIDLWKEISLAVPPSLPLSISVSLSVHVIKIYCV